MTTIQLHVDPALAGEHAVRVYEVRPPARLGDREEQRYVGLLRLPPGLIQRFQQMTPLVEPLADECRIAWTGVALEPLPPEPMLEKVAKLMRGMKRLVVPS
jgi:hypothetical protein